MYRDSVCACVVLVVILIRDRIAIASRPRRCTARPRARTTSNSADEPCYASYPFFAATSGKEISTNRCPAATLFNQERILS